MLGLITTIKIEVDMFKVEAVLVAEGFVIPSVLGISD
jgi:hypothetical protein